MGGPPNTFTLKLKIRLESPIVETRENEVQNCYLEEEGCQSISKINRSLFKKRK